jgi:hypothetical protein
MQESDGTTSLPGAPWPCVASERPSHASPPCDAVYGLSARASSAKACCCCASPIGRYPVWTPTRPLLLVLSRTRPPTTMLWASPQLHPAWWARHAAGLPHTTLGLPGGLAVGGGRGKRARKGTWECTSCYPYPASFARLKHLRHLKHSSQSLPRITHLGRYCTLFVLGSRPASRCWYAMHA